MKTMKHLIKRVMDFPVRLYRLRNQVEALERQLVEQKLLTGKLLSQFNANRPIDNLHDAEFKVFSQYGDDGIIQHLIHHLDVQPHVFVEFGVQDYTEANTRFLLLNDNWSGFVMDGSPENIEIVRRSTLPRVYDLQAKSAFITRENINDLIAESGIQGDIGLLSIDIDGNDYWVWQAITVVTPVIVVAEYNSVFGADKAWTVPYRSDFMRNRYHHSNLCYGASLASLHDLAEEKGYALVGCNSQGNNAYFVRRDHLGSLKPVSVGDAFVESRFSEGRDVQGRWTLTKGAERLSALNGIEVFNTRTAERETIHA